VITERLLGPTNPKTKEHLEVNREEALVASSLEHREHILFVDDDKRIVQIGQEILEHLGYRVTGVTSSMAALEKVRRQPEKFDLVITDFTMPRMNGVELARELSRVRPGMPIILYTGKSKAVTAENARNLGIKDYLLKPVTAMELHQAIRRVLDAGMGGGGHSKH